MQAIILAAGMGRRLGDYTKANTKCMVPVNGVRLIDRMLCQLSELHLSRIIIVTGYQGQNLREHIGSRYDDKVRIEFIDNPQYETTNNIWSLALASRQMCEDDTILLESDLIFEEKVLRKLVDSPEKNVAMVASYESWMDGTMVRIDQEFNIVNFVPKEAFRYEDVDQYFKTVNIYKFSKEFCRDSYVPMLEAYCKVMGNNEYYEQVLRVLIHLHRSQLKALPVRDGKWYEIDDVQDLDIASTIFSDGTVKYHEYHKRYGGYWRFPQLLDYCYLVNPFFPPKRMKDELKSNFDALLTNYPSGQYVNSLLAGKHFGISQDYVVVGNGAAELIKVVMENHAGALSDESDTTCVLPTASKVGVIYPTFDEYPNRLSSERIVPFIPQNGDFSYTADDLMAHFSGKGIGLLLLVNPDNPSGNYMPKSDVLRLAGWCRSNGIKLLVDESFVDFADSASTEICNHAASVSLGGSSSAKTGIRALSLLDNEILEANDNMMVMKSISKSYGIPGLRLGVLASADKALIAKIKKEVSIWNINSFGEFFLQISGKYEKDYETACGKFIKEREIFHAELETIPYLRVIPSQANYFLCEVVDRFTSAELTQKLIEQNVLISNCGRKNNMAGRQLIRLAVRGREDNSRLIEILRSL